VSEETSAEAEERQRRIQALHELAQPYTTGGQTAVPLLRPRAPSRRPRALLLALLLVVALASGSAWYVTNHRIPAQTLTPPIPDVLTLDLTKDHLTLPTMAAYSPDGRALAVLASASTTTPDVQRLPVAAVYDARTGKLTRRFALDTLLAAKQWSGSPFTLTWQPDGKGLALPYSVAQLNNPSVFVNGLLLLPLHGDARLLITPAGNAFFPRAVWDVRAGRAVPGSDTPPPLAVTYQFAVDGRLVAGTSTPAPQGTGGFTGSPVQGTRQGGFSRWQAGTLDPITQLGGPQSPPTDELFASFVPQWSADGRYLSVARFVTRVNAHGASSAPPAGDFCAHADDADIFEACHQPAAVLPDPALQAVLAVVQTGQSPVAPEGIHLATTWVGAPVDWRPDGKVLATIFPADGPSSQDPFAPNDVTRVTLLSTATGQVLAILSAKRAPDYGASSVSAIAPTAWSPRGDQLALVDYAGRITIWGAANLATLPH
jgi:hypothetical protein